VQQDRTAIGAFGAIVLAIVALTWPTWVHMVRSWLGPAGSSHGFLVAAIAIWLAWRALASQPARAAEPAWWMLLPTAAASFLWLFFRAATVSVLEETAATILIWTSAASVLGWQRGRALLFPVGYLFVVIPVWDALIPILQPLTTAAAGGVCQLLGIPTYLEGNTVHIPNGVFEIEEGCAGLRYFVSAVAIAALYAHLEYKRWSSWAALIGLAAVLAVVGNWIRVVFVIRTGYISGMQHPWVKDHAGVGWVIFAFSLVPLFAIARRLEGLETGVVSAEPTVVAGPAQSPARIAAAFLAAVAAAGWPLVVLATARPEPSSDPKRLVAPAGEQGWRGPLAPDGHWNPASSPADGQYLVSYDDGTTRITVFHAYYRTQAQGREIIGYDNRIEGDEGWTLAEENRLVHPELGEWRRAILTRRDNRRRIALYRYTVSGRPTASRLEAKLRQGLSPFTGDSSASIFAASTPCGDSCAKAAEVLMRFIKLIHSTN